MPRKLRRAPERKVTSKSFHVIPRASEWAVVTEDDSRMKLVFDTQAEAIDAARRLAKETAGQLAIHGKSGRIRERNSYSSDPFPIRQTRKVLRPSTPPQTRKRRDIGKAISVADRESSAI